MRQRDFRDSRATSLAKNAQRARQTGAQLAMAQHRALQQLVASLAERLAFVEAAHRCEYTANGAYDINTVAATLVGLNGGAGVEDAAIATKSAGIVTIQRTGEFLVKFELTFLPTAALQSLVAGLDVNGVKTDGGVEGLAGGAAIPATSRYEQSLALSAGDVLQPYSKRVGAAGAATLFLGYTKFTLIWLGE